MRSLYDLLYGDFQFQCHLPLVLLCKQAEDTFDNFWRDLNHDRCIAKQEMSTCLSLTYDHGFLSCLPESKPTTLLTSSPPILSSAGETLDTHFLV